MAASRRLLLERFRYSCTAISLCGTTFYIFSFELLLILYKPIHRLFSWVSLQKLIGSHGQEVNVKLKVLALQLVSSCKIVECEIAWLYVRLVAP